MIISFSKFQIIMNGSENRNFVFAHLKERERISLTLIGEERKRSEFRSFLKRAEWNPLSLILDERSESEIRSFQDERERKWACTSLVINEFKKQFFENEKQYKLIVSNLKFVSIDASLPELRFQQKRKYFALNASTIKYNEPAKQYNKKVDTTYRG